MIKLHNMKSIYLLGISCLSMTFMACSGNSSTPSDAPKATSTSAGASVSTTTQQPVVAVSNTTDPASDQFYIPKDSANMMIESYMNSFGSTPPDENVSSWTLDAEALRNYLSDYNIKHVKVSLAHTQSYMAQGHTNQPAGYKNDALTIVVSGYDNDGNYILVDGERVMDRVKPCPSMCPAGPAGHPTIH